MSDTITLTKAELDIMIGKAVKAVTDAMAQPPARPRKVVTHDLTDQGIVAKSNAAKKVAKFFKNGDANEPMSYPQRRRLIALATVAWDELAGLSTAQAAVASYWLEKGDRVTVNGLTLNPR